ncbi:SSI family serine proteinase inhibitor [Streptomyces sp. NPDC060064]|uniref:SSI family serine proteinase inhibitor n=1 Tax=Streptomyces sp. NPDC060064 TaxID=3347049 RepID=UPI0036998445
MRRSATFAAAALIALAAAAPAAASPAHTAGEVPTRARGLFLTVSGSENTWIRGVLLQCPTQTDAPHPHARAACRALSAVKGDLDVLPGDPRPCNRKYDPVTVSATGTWRGFPIAWHKTYPNACALDVATGVVFRF